MSLTTNTSDLEVESPMTEVAPPAEQDSLEPVTTPPALVLEPVRITDFVLLINLATRAAQSLDRFIQFREPRASDVETLEALRQALAPFYPVRP